MLQSINRLLARASQALFGFLAFVFELLTPVLRGLFGSWEAPGWLRVSAMVWPGSGPGWSSGWVLW